MVSVMRALFFLGYSFLVGLVMDVGVRKGANGDILRSDEMMQNICGINKEGSHLGIVVPNSFEMSPLLGSSSFHPHLKTPFFDFSGRRFRLGKLGKHRVVIVMTGLGMLNAGIATELLLSIFKVKGVLHYGIAGNANPNLQIADVTIPRSWAHTGLWNWQRYGDGPEAELALESNGDYTRAIGYLRFSAYNNDTRRGRSSSAVGNFLNNVWYQAEEIFPVDGTPEVRQHAFWVSVDEHYFALTKKLVNTRLGRCVNSTSCLPRRPMVVRVDRGISANVFVDNSAYRRFLNHEFNATPIDMETAAVALVCAQHKTPFIAFRSLSDLAGGGSSVSNEAQTFASLAAQNAVDTVIRFTTLLSP